MSIPEGSPPLECPLKPVTSLLQMASRKVGETIHKKTQKDRRKSRGLERIATSFTLSAPPGPQPAPMNLLEKVGGGGSGREVRPHWRSASARASLPLRARSALAGGAHKAAGGRRGARCVRFHRGACGARAAA